MNTLAKIILFSSPVLFFVLFFVISSQKSSDIQIKTSDSLFEKLWNENEAAMTKDPAMKKVYEERAKKSEMEMEELKKKELERELKEKQFEEAMEKALKDSEKELKEKLK